MISITYKYDTSIHLYIYYGSEVVLLGGLQLSVYFVNLHIVLRFLCL